MGFGFIAIGMMEPLVPLYSLFLGASPAFVGMIVASAHLFPIFVAMPTGSLADRWGPRRVAALGAVLFLAGPSLIVLVPGLTALLLAQILMGIGQLGLILAAQTYVGLITPAEQLESYFGWYTTAVSAGQLAGPLLAGVFVDAAGFRPAFIATLAIAILPALLTRGLLDRPSADRDPSPAVPSPKPVGKFSLLRNPQFQLAVFGSCGVLVALGVRRAFLPLYLDELAFSASFIGLVLSTWSLFSMAVRSVMARLVEALGGRGTALIIMTLVTAISIGTLGLVLSPSLLIFLTV